MVVNFFNICFEWKEKIFGISILNIFNTLWSEDKQLFLFKYSGHDCEIKISIFFISFEFDLMSKEEWEKRKNK